MVAAVVENEPNHDLRVVVLADTHMRTPGPHEHGRPPGLPATAWEHLRGADAILHAGDILDAGVLTLLAAVAPVYAVLGNNDLTLVGLLPTARVVEIGGVRIGMIHDSGMSDGRAERMNRRFPDAHVVVFGHSHVPVNEQGVGNQLLFNPGSPTQRRAQPVHTLGEFRIAGGALVEHRIIALDSPPVRHT